MLMTVIPSPLLGLHLQDREFRLCLCYWLGVPLHNDQFNCLECHGVADSLGDHQVGCGGNSDRISRHNTIRDVVFNAAQSAALGPLRETPGLVPDSASRPADVLLFGSTAFMLFLPSMQSLTLSEDARKDPGPRSPSGHPT